MEHPRLLLVKLLNVCAAKAEVTRHKPNLTDRDDDLKSAEDFVRMVDLSDALIDARIDGLRLAGSEAPKVKDLLRRLLRVNPQHRLQSLAEVLSQPFFTGADSGNSSEQQLKAMREEQLRQGDEQRKQTEEQQRQAEDLRRTLEAALHTEAMTEQVLANTVQLKQMSLATLIQIKRTEAVLLKGMIEAADVTVPSSFIVVSHKLNPAAFADKPHGLDWEQITEAVAEDPAAPHPVAEVQGKAEAASRWLGYLGGVGKRCSEAVSRAGSAVSKAADIVGDSRAFFSEKFADKTQTVLYLYLVNEVTHKPVIPPEGSGSPYPLKITAPTAFVGKFMPLMKVGLKAMAVWNGVAGLAQCFGYPVPKIPAGVCRSIKSAVGALDAKSSVAEFDVLQGEVDSALLADGGGKSDEEKAEAAKKARGKQLRDLQAFFAEDKHDPKGDFSGLRRVLTPEGYCVWTTDEDAKDIEAKGKAEADADWTDAVQSLLD